MTEKSARLMSDRKPHIREALRTWRRINTKQTKQNYTQAFRFKLQKIKDEKKNCLKGARGGENPPHLQRIKMRIIFDFSSETKQARRH